MFPKCDVCGQELKDWQGNVMILTNDFQNRTISEIILICKFCTEELDKKGVGQKWHNLWELAWIKRHTIYHLGNVMADLISDQPKWKWSEPAVEKVYSLAAMAHPDLARGAIEQLLIDIGEE